MQIFYKIERKCIAYIIYKSRLAAYGRVFGSVVWFYSVSIRLCSCFFHVHELIWEKEEIWCANSGVEVT